MCGKHVRADLCSLHLDTDCSGVSHPSPAGDKDKTAGVIETRKGLNISSKDAKAEEEGGTDAARAGGLEALAAELTCPIW